ncbi:MAG: methionine gamma-lyase family protein [Vampirovibrionales bacterium]|nr:methionine gamma-lyase family protein [Vampirovibrionales bacterium]
MILSETTAPDMTSSRDKNPLAIQRLMVEAEQELGQTVWPRLENIAQVNFNRVLEAFITHKVGEEHFASVTGYGHDDLGRQVTDAVFADALQAEAALVRPHFVSGTHAIAVALRGCLKPKDRLLAIAGQPYDTLEEVIGIRGNSPQSLTAMGVEYNQIDIFENQPYEAFSPQQIEALQASDVIFIQRSRGYGNRPSLCVGDIERLVVAMKAIHPKLVVMVDNCYGEFTETQEPTAVGADLMAGSLIKNPGGGIVPAGGYVAGKSQWVASAADALTCPGVGSKGGYTFELTRLLLQGLFMAPGVVKEALKGMTLSALLLEKLGYDTSPRWDEARSDIIQMLHLKEAKRLVAFCQAIQKVSPVESAVLPIPSEVPGYGDEVVMAAGTFIEGSTIELSADGPLRAPYIAFLQGGLSVHHTRYALEKILQSGILD